MAQRITPAYAGKSAPVEVIAGLPLDHPRVCGEKSRTQRKSLKTSGSPPRMRGKVRLERRAGHVQGITPAYAGKRELEWQKVERCRDHPRVCGEKVYKDIHHVAAMGITPAYAGKS